MSWGCACVSTDVDFHIASDFRGRTKSAAEDINANLGAVLPFARQVNGADGNSRVADDVGRVTAAIDAACDVGTGDGNDIEAVSLGDCL